MFSVSLSVLIVVFLVMNTVFLIILLAKKDKNGSEELKNHLKDEFEKNRKETAEQNSSARQENNRVLLDFQQNLNSSVLKFSDSVSQRMEGLMKLTVESLDRHKDVVQKSLASIQESNEKKLEEMRNTVDEKLQSTLEKRLTGSFEIVTKQLEAVQKGLGEMQALASDVGGLKRALTNVKTAGGIGEIQLEALLEQMLSPEQYVKNAHPNPRKSTKVVEFAIKLPSKTEDNGSVLLPIDSKYPAEVWDKLSLAYSEGNKEEIERQRHALVTDIRKMAKDIAEKYIEIPYTTDFGLLFLPFESLFSEVIRIPGLFQQIQDECKVTIAGPTTLGAFLNSLQMGFRTLTIQKETSKIWDLLGSVKSEFGKFGIGDKTACQFMAEIEDIKNFGTYQKLIAFAGTDPAIYQSGQQSTSGHITKHGNANLRRVCYIMATKCVAWNPILNNYYTKKRTEGFPHRKAMIATMNKMIKIIFILLTRGEKFKIQTT